MSRELLTGALAVLLLLARGIAADELDHRVGLADLAAYREALSGKATAKDVPAAEPVRPVSFRDLWDQPDAWKGHRVQVRGKLVRVFRQDAVGGFPPLVEAWLRTPRGDLFCTVFPTASVPEPGQDVAFRGTFLRTIQYAGSDQPRLAPWIVGDRPPERVTTSAAVAEGPWNRPVASWSRGSYVVVIALALTLVVAGAGVLTWHNRKSAHNRESAIPNPRSEPPLVFLESEPVNGSAVPHSRPH